MSETILAVGGTGMLGEPVARRLASEGYTVRVFSRSAESARRKFGAGFEVVQGNVLDVPSLELAMKGCVGVHVNLDGHGDWTLEPRGACNVALAAARHEIRRITLISGASTCEENTWFPMTKAKFDAENAIRASGIPFTIFRCTMFMELVPTFVREGKAMILGKQLLPWHWVASDDYAAMVSKSYATAAAAGKTLYVYGPEPLTMEQAVEFYRAACAPDAKLTRVPFGILSIMAMFPGRTELRRVGLPLMRYFSKVRETGDPTEADELLGKPKITLAEWCRARQRCS
jgi:uncharacterized protein YbjT (DUF2867 family)